jgi:hypothetical protein
MKRVGMRDSILAGSGEPRESRLYAAIAILALPFIVAFLPGRYQLMPKQVLFIAAAALAIPMLGAQYARNNAAWERWERYTAAVILPFAAIQEFVLLGLLINDMAKAHPSLTGLTLLTTSVWIWVTNVLIFALIYWQIDRGGPNGRTSGWQGRSDFTFPRGDPSDGVPEDWQPAFADYLALAFNTSAAFTPTDVLPLTPRAKMLMVMQGIVSLVTVIAVGARAINILGS